MKWYNKLYIGENAGKRKRKIINNIRFNKPQLGVYVITLPTNDKNSLDIYPSNALLQKYYKKRDLTVVGIAEGRDESLMLIQRIIMDCYNQTGQYLVKELVGNDISVRRMSHTNRH